MVLNNIDNPFPRVGDKWFMRVFKDIQFSPQELQQLNRVRLHQQVLFLSDILCVRGTKIDTKYKKRLRWENEKWSKLDFPAEEPLPKPKDFKVWQSALSQPQLHSPTGGPLSGNWLHIGHKLLPWRYCTISNTLFRHHHHDEDLMDIYILRMMVIRGDIRSMVQYGSDHARGFNTTPRVLWMRWIQRYIAWSAMPPSHSQVSRCPLALYMGSSRSLGTGAACGCGKILN